MKKFALLASLTFFIAGSAFANDLKPSVSKCVSVDLHCIIAEAVLGGHQNAFDFFVAHGASPTYTLVAAGFNMKEYFLEKAFMAVQSENKSIKKIQ